MTIFCENRVKKFIDHLITEFVLHNYPQEVGTSHFLAEVMQMKG